MLSFDPPENIRKTDISYPLRKEMLGFQGDQKETLGRKGLRAKLQPN